MPRRNPPRAREVVLALAVGLVAAGCGDGPLAPEAPAPPAAPGPAAAAPVADRGDGAYPGFRVAAFRAKVRRPSAGGAAEAAFDSRTTKTPTLYIVNSAGCPSCAAYAERMKAVETKYMAKGVDVVHVYPNRTETADEKVAWHAKQGFAGGQIVDDGAAVARALEADRTPTVYLVDAAGRIVYRGGIDDGPYGNSAPRTYLADAIDAFLAGRPIAEDTTEPYG